MTIVAVFVLGLAIGAITQMGVGNFVREILSAATEPEAPTRLAVEVDET